MKTLKKMLAVFLVIIMLLSSTPLQGFVGLELPEWFAHPFSAIANAEAEEISSGECGSNLSWSFDADGTLTISGEGKMTNYIHPELMSSYSTSDASVMSLETKDAAAEQEISYSGFDFGLELEPRHAEMTSNLLNNAAEIDEEEIEEPTEVAPWSDYSDQIKRVVIEEGVTYVGTCAFMLCYNLESVVLADSVKEISYYAFAACFSLGSINLQRVEKIGYYALMYAMELESVVLESAETISENAFACCLGLKTVTFSDNLKTIGEGAFQECVNLSKITIPESVETIGRYAFSYMILLQEIANKSLTAAASEYLSFQIACNDIDNAEKCAFIMAEAMKIQMRADLLDESWTEESMINAILVKFNEKFDTTYSFEELVEFIDSQDTSGGVPSYFNVYCYESSAEHEQCKASGVPHILFGESEQHICFDFMGVSGDLNWKIDLDTRTLTFSGSGRMADYSSYSNKAPWISLSEYYDYVVFAEDSEITYIGSSAFAYSDFESITIPASVSSIGYDAFSYNKKLKTVAFEENSAMTYFTSSLFYSCASLETVDIPAGVYSIDSSAFNGCDALKTLNIHPDNTNLLLEDSIIYNYDKSTIMLCLKNKAGAVVIPASVTTINSYCFDSCNLITSISFGENSNINYLSGFANYCDALETVTLPKSLTSIYDSFSSCDSLTSIKVEEGSSSLYSDDGVLYNYGKTTLLKYPAGRSGEYEVLSGTTVISGSAFSDSQKLTKVILPEGLTSIGSSAFSFCEKLSDIVIPESVTSIGSYAFSYTALESVIIPLNVTRVEYNAFQRCADLKEITFNNKDCFIGSGAVPSETTIKGYTASTAEDYAIANGNEFVAIDDMVIESISIESLPDKTKYSVGSSFEADGLAIKINFNDGTSIIKSDNLNVTGFNSKKPGLCTLTVEYVGYKVTFDVEIYEINSEILLGETIELKLDVGDTAYIKFVPEFSGDYPLETKISEYSYNSHELNVAVCDESKTQLGTSYYVYLYNNNTHNVSFSLEAGKTYYFRVRYTYNYSNTDSTAFDITLKCGHKTTNNYEEVPATCTSTGFTAGVFCEDCKQWISGHEVTDYKHTDENKDFICDLCNADAKQLLASGNCGYDGDNIKWYLYDSGLLELIGTGKMQNYSGTSPWWNYTDSMHNPESIDIDIKRVTLSDGITNVGASAFNSLYTVEEFILPDSIISLEYCAFSGCSNLSEITLPSNLQSIGTNAFAYCNALKEIVVPDGVTSIGDHAFSLCNNLVYLSLPESIISVSNGAFYMSESLVCVFYAGTEVDWSNISIGNNNYPLINAVKIYSSKPGEVVIIAEGDCNESIHWTIYSDGLFVLEGSGDMPDYNSSNAPWNKYRKCIKEINISEGITSVGGQAFYSCINLNKVILSDTVTTIGEYAFYGCTRLTEINLPDSLESISRYAFTDCLKLTQIVVPDGIKTLNDYTFSGCNSLVSIVLPESLETINAGVFASCFSLSEINIPENVSCIASGSFYDCGSLVRITVNGKNDYYCDVDGVLFNKDKTTLMRFPQKHSATAYTVPDSVTYIDTYAFSDCCNLTEMVIPNSVESLGSSAFYNCNTLRELSVPASLDYNYNAFYDCSYISEIYISKGNGKMADLSSSTYHTPWYASVNNYPAITLENGITNIGAYAFYCNTFSAITIPDSVTEIGDYAFYGCSNLNEIVIPEAVTKIGEYAFAYCHSIESFVIPSETEKIGLNAFAPCKALKNITVEEDNSSYVSENGVLYNKDKTILICFPAKNSQSEFIMPDSVTTINSYAFYNCSSLSEVILPESVSKIDTYAFYNCNGIKKIMIYNPECTIYKGGNTISSSATIYGYNNSTAQQYASTYSRSFVEIPCSHSEKYVTEHEEVPATCTEDGITAGKFCKCCKTWIEGHETLEATGHTFTENSMAIIKEPTCTESGVEVRCCSVCGAEGGEWVTGNSNDYPETPHYYVSGKTYNYSYKLDGAKKLLLKFSSRTQTESGYDKIYIYDAAGKTYGPYSGNELTSKEITLEGDNFSIKLTTDGSIEGYGFSFYYIKGYMVDDSLLRQIDALGHEYDENWTVDEEATCETDGSKSRHCIRCNNYTDTAAVPALGHDYSEEFTVDKKETCTTDGSKSRHCSRCSSKTDVTVIEAAGHSYSDVVTEPTCTKDGYTTHTCSKCKYVYTDSTVSALGHDYSEEFTVDKKENCTTDGSKSRHCIRCDSKTDVTVIEATGHNYSSTVVDPTCTAEGYTKHTCSKCRDTYNDSTVSALGHDYSEEFTVDKKETCTEDGSKSRHCSRCNSKTDVTVIEATGHNYSSTVVDPTCTAEGYTKHTCSKCRDAYNDSTVAALGHDYSEEFTVDEKETCTIDGSKSRHCSRCNSKTDVTVIEAPGHNYDSVVTEPTCTTDGYTTHTCSNCKHVYTDSTVAALGHEYNTDWTVDKKATCEEDGSKSRHCARCKDYTDIEVIPALGHNYSEEFTVDSKETCTENGSKSRHCSRCDSKTDITVIEAPGHSYSSVTVNVTCTADGYTKHTCARCKNSYTDNVIKSEGHKYNSVTVEPTCTKEGYTTHTCTVCNSGYSDSRTPAKGHAYGDWAVLKAATIFEDGLRERVCATCSFVEKQVIEKISIDINENKNYGLVRFKVVNAQSLEPINGASLFVSTEKEGETTIFTDENGEANLILPVGSVNVSAFSSGLQVRNIKINVKPGENTVPEIGLSSMDVYDAELTAKEMTLDEMVEAGIDINNTENQHVDKYEFKMTMDPQIDFPSINFYFDGGLYIGGEIEIPEPKDDGKVELHYHLVGVVNNHKYCKRIRVKPGENVSLDYKPDVSSDEFEFDGWYEDATFTKKITHVTVNEDMKVYGKLTPLKTVKPEPVVVEDKAIYPVSEKMFLIINGEVSWLKEMFDVQLLVINNSNTDSLGELHAELALPEGLSLAKMIDKDQKLSVDLAPIPEGGFGTANWYIKGDKEGSYNLSASLTGKIYPFGEEINESFELENSISVLAGSALHMNFEVPDVVYYGYDFPVKITLTNVSGKTIYNIGHVLTGLKQSAIVHYSDETEKETIFMNETGDLLREFAREFKPGDKIVFELDITAKYVSELMEHKIKQMLAKIDAIESATKLIKVMDAVGSLTSGLCNLLEKCTKIKIDEIVGVAGQKKDIVVEIFSVIGDILGLIKANISNQSISNVISYFQALTSGINAFANPESLAAWVEKQSVDNIVKFYTDLKAFRNALADVKTIGEFDLFDSLRAAISAIPVSFVLEDVIFKTDHKNSTTEIPKSYTVVDNGYQYFGVVNVSKYIQAFKAVIADEIYDFVMPGWIQLFPGCGDLTNSDEAKLYIKATEKRIEEIQVIRQKNAENGTVRYRSWIETNEPTTYSLRRTSTEDLFELSSSDNETAKLENGVLTFEGSATLDIVPKSTVGGILHIEGDDGTSAEVEIDVVEQHECNSDEFHSILPPVDGEKGYGLKCCSICEEIIDIVELDSASCGENHSFGEWNIIAEAECDASEIKSRCCELCGYIETAFGDAKGHNEKTVNAVDATCTESGYSGDVLCETCGETISEGTVIDAKGHKDITVNAVDATCTEPGYSGDVLCEICGETVAEGTVIDAVGHEYDESSITKQPTCTESGEAKGKCIRCDDYNVTILDPLEHSYDKEVIAPTCTEKGYTIYTCSACGDCYLSNIVGIIPHSYESVVTEPTCTEEGFTTHSCKVCGDNYTDSYVEAKSHSYVKAVIEPTCTTNGYTTYTCTACGEGYSGDFVDKLGHKGGIAGCSELAVCDVCGEYYGEFDNDNHTNIVIDESVDPTCSESGLTEGKHCEACGEVLTAQIVIEKLSHKYETVVTEPTCTEKGCTTYTCSDCGDYYMGDYKDSVEHEYNKNGVCDKCGEDRTENCSCNCHKSGISKFFFELILFFQKIFKTNKVCKCGIKHY